MFDPLDVAHDLDAALTAGDTYETPFPLTVFRPFSAARYAAILNALPDDRHYQPLMHQDAVRPDGTSSRLVLPLNDEGLATLPPDQRDFWSDFAACMRSNPVRDAFLSHLEPHIVARYGHPLKDVPCFPTARLGRDFDGYRITPHPDAANRVYTAQAYLPADDSMSQAGTTIYRRDDAGEFHAVRRLSYLPDTAFCFARTDHTWHGVETLSLTRPRDNLHISAFDSPKAF